MTHQQKLEVIRQACIKAGGVSYEKVAEHGDGTYIAKIEPIRLAGVLNALMYTEHVVCIASNERFEILNKAKNKWEQAFKTWRLDADDLSMQSEETISFLYELLK